MNGDVAGFGGGGSVTLLSYRLHLSLGVALFAALIFSAANDILHLGFFGRGARAVSTVTILLFVVYGVFFMPTRKALREYVSQRRSPHDP
jgi:hypothetical protein